MEFMEDPKDYKCDACAKSISLAGQLNNHSINDPFKICNKYLLALTNSVLFILDFHSFHSMHIVVCASSCLSKSLHFSISQ